VRGWARWGEARCCVGEPHFTAAPSSSRRSLGGRRATWYTTACRCSAAYAWYVARAGWGGERVGGDAELSVQWKQRALSSGRAWIAGYSRQSLVRAVDGGRARGPSFPLLQTLGFGLDAANARAAAAGGGEATDWVGASAGGSAADHPGGAAGDSAVSTPGGTVGFLQGQRRGAAGVRWVVGSA
jgi:hypothetical protein